MNEAASFLVELATIAAFVYFGFAWFEDAAPRWIVGLGLPAVVAVAWGFFLAPRSSRRLKIGPGLALSTALFLCAAVLLFLCSQTVLGIVLLATSLANRFLVFIWKQW